MTRSPLCSPAEVSDRVVPVVLGGDILAYSYARCFHEAFGIITKVVSAVDVKVTSSSRFVDYAVEPVIAQGDDAIVRFLADLGSKLVADGKIPLLLGSADWQVRVIVEHAEALGQWFVVPYNDIELYEDITQKERFYAICEELGMAYPRTHVFSCADPTTDLHAESFDYPLIAKPSNSAQYDLMAFEGKEKIYEVASPAELECVFGLLCEAGYTAELIVQDFIPGGDDAIYSLTTFSDDAGDVRIVSGGRVALQDHSPARIGNPVCIKLERVEQLIEDAKRFCSHVGYRGYANFDAKYDERDGRYKFFEVNARPGANSYYLQVGGVNFARVLVDYFILGKPAEYREAFGDAVYTLVPARVIKRFVSDVSLREKVLRAYRDGRAFSPFTCKDDTFAHCLWAYVRSARQFEKFKRYCV